MSPKGHEWHNMSQKDYQWVSIVSGTLLGAGLALLITGYALKEKEIHNEGNSQDGVPPPEI